MMAPPWLFSAESDARVPYVSDDAKGPLVDPNAPNPTTPPASELWSGHRLHRHRDQ